MIRLRFVALGASIALALAGCNPLSSSSGATTVPAPVTSAPGITSAPATTSAPTAGVTALATSATAEPDETSAPTAPAATATSGTPAPPTGEIQREQMTLNAERTLEPATITTTVGVTLALTLINQSDGEALLVFDLSPSGAFGVTLRSTAAITGTPAPIATPGTPTATPQLLLVPTSRATAALAGTSVAETSVPTRTAESIRTTTPTTATTTPTPPAGATELVYLRFDQPGSYQVRCTVPEDTPEQDGCAGSVTILVQETAPAPTRTPAATAGTPEITATAALTSTAPITTTAVVTSTAAITSTSAITGTSAPAATGTASTAGTAPAATAETTAAPATTATP